MKIKRVCQIVIEWNKPVIHLPIVVMLSFCACKLSYRYPYCEIIIILGELMFEDTVIVYKHLSDTREFITLTVELWIRWMN